MDQPQKETDFNPVAAEETSSIVSEQEDASIEETHSIVSKQESAVEGVPLTVREQENDLEWERFIQRELGKLDNQAMEEGNSDKATSTEPKVSILNAIIEQLPVERIVDSAFQILGKRFGLGSFTDPQSTEGKNNTKKEKAQRGSERKNSNKAKGKKDITKNNLKRENVNRGVTKKDIADLLNYINIKR